RRCKPHSFVSTLCPSWCAFLRPRGAVPAVHQDGRPTRAVTTLAAVSLLLHVAVEIGPVEFDDSFFVLLTRAPLDGSVAYVKRNDKMALAPLLGINFEFHVGAPQVTVGNGEFHGMVGHRTTSTTL